MHDAWGLPGSMYGLQLHAEKSTVLFCDSEIAVCNVLCSLQSFTNKLGLINSILHQDMIRMVDHGKDTDGVGVFLFHPVLDSPS